MCPIPSHPFISPILESGPEVSKQAGYWIQIQKLLPGLISSNIFAKKLCWRSLSKSGQGNKCPRLATFPSRLKWSLKQSSIPSVIWWSTYVLLLPRSCIITLLVDRDHSDYFNFQKQKKRDREKKCSRQNSCTWSALALKVWWKHNPAQNP